MDYPKRNEQSAKNFLAGQGEVELGLSKKGKRVMIVSGTAIAVSEAAYDKLRQGDAEGLQYFEFQVDDTWIPVICKAGGGLENSVKLTF